MQMFYRSKDSTHFSLHKKNNFTEQKNNFP